MKTNHANFYTYFRFFICVLAYFYSVITFAATEYTYDNKKYASSCPAAVDVSGLVNTPEFPSCKASPHETFKHYAYIMPSNGCVTFATVQCSFREAQPTPTPPPAPKNCQPQAGQSAGKLIWSLTSAGDNKGSSCNSGCKTTANDYKCGLASGKTYCTGHAAYTGQTCTGTENPNADAQTETPNPTPKPTLPPHVTPTPPPLTDAQETAKCVAKGKTTGTINGKIICVNPSPDAPTTETKTSTSEKTNPDGSKTETKTETTTTDKGDGKVKTDTTKTTKTPEGGTRPDGSKCTMVGGCTDVEGEGKEEPKTDFCKDNPNDDKCKKQADDSVTGSCDAFKCSSDDVVSCEIARINWKSYCESTPDKDDVLVKLGNEVIKNNGNMSTDMLEGINGTSADVIAIDTKLISQKRFLQSGCWSDLKLEIYGGRSLIIPFSILCYWLELFGKLIILFSWIASARIVMGFKN